MCKFLRSLAEYLAALAFLCCHYIFDSYITCLTLSFNTVCVLPFTLILCVFIVLNIISAALKSILSQFRCSLEPENFLWGPTGVLEYPQTTQLCWCSLHPLFCRLYWLLGSCVIVAYRAPVWRKPATHKHFFPKQTCLKVVSTTFLLVWLLSLNESPCQTRKNAFYFTWKAVFVLKKIKF